MFKKCKCLLSLIFVFLLAFTAACSTCVFSEGVEYHTDLQEFNLTVTDPDIPTFESIINLQFVTVRNGTFEARGGYDRPNEELPESLRNFYFFFRATAIGNDSNIFDESMGTTFKVSGDIPNEEGVDYYEHLLESLTPDGSGRWAATSYSGTVSIIADDLVEFNMIFSDGNKSRQLFAVYQFQSFETSNPTGNCD